MRQVFRFDTAASRAVGLSVRLGEPPNLSPWVDVAVWPAGLCRLDRWGGRWEDGA